MPAAPLLIAGAAVVGAGAAVVGTVKTIDAQNKAAKAQKQQYAYEKQMSQNRSLRERRDAIRAARLTQGSLIQTAETQGASDTSSALGGLGSIQSQLNDNLSFLDTQTSLANRAGDQSAVAKQAQTNASNWGAISSLGMAIFSQASSRIK